MILACSLSFLVSLLLLWVLLNTRLRRLAVDIPNHRSLHTVVIPRTGGLALMLGVLVSWMWLNMHVAWFLGVIVLMAVSLLDDVLGLSVRWRFVAQILVAIAFLALFMQLPVNFLTVVFVFAIVWLTNLYNFMDGSDGLAGGMAVFGFGAYTLAAYWSGDVTFAMMNACIVASALAFLLFNFHPAKIFMGDAGSIPLGFLSGAIGLYGWEKGYWSLWFPMMVFAPFIVDATLTLLKRGLRGEKVWQAHREHYYQRLIQLGWGHKKTALAEYGLMIFSVTMSFWMMKNENSWVVILLILVYLFLIYIVDRLWAQRSKL